MPSKKRGKKKRPARSGHRPPVDARRAANEASVRTFFAASDPAWRWVLILGLRDLRANASRLGDLAAAESPEGASWADDRYVYGPLVHGITAAAVNECAQHCEDLFAVLMFLREDLEFSKRMLSYNAGSVTRSGSKLRELNDEAIAKQFVVPASSLVEEGLTLADDPSASVAMFEEAVARLGQRVRRVVDWYETYEDFHLQYKHGLKLAMRPYGNPTPEAIAERRDDVAGTPLFAFTAEPISKMLKGPSQQHGVIFPNLVPEARAHLTALVEERAVLRYKMSGPPVDLNEVAEISGTVVQLLRIAAANRLAVGQDLNEGTYSFELPGDKRYETVTVVLALDRPPVLGDFR